MVASSESWATLDSLFQQTRQQFIDEIFFTTPCERSIVQNVLDQARVQGVDLRVVPDMYDGVAWNSPIEYIGQFPTIPLHRGEVPEIGLVFKRVFDMIFSALALVVLSPLLLAIAIAIKLDSPGPVFYTSERIGKKGVVFRCIKFRTMVRDAEQRRAEIMHMNERDGVLFKISNDPRVTGIGRFLRKYSLDELPQFFNVLRGDMSVVGPVPPGRRGPQIRSPPSAAPRRDPGHHRSLAGPGAPRPIVYKLCFVGRHLYRDMGADVVRLERPGPPPLMALLGRDLVGRGRPTLHADLKQPAGRDLVLALIERADALIEGFRPGVMERLGLGPDVALARNPRLVYGRMTGYGQDGPLAAVPGHDINYIAVAGVLGAIARAGERPLFPLNLLGDYGGGGTLLAFGIVCGVLEARASGAGQVVDAAMVDGAALLSTVVHGMRAGGVWSDTPGTNTLDSGAPFYEVYATADGRHVAVGAIESQFYDALLAALEIDPESAPQWERDRWPELKARFAAAFRARTAEQWRARLERSDACASIVLAPGEAPVHPHNLARGTFVEHDGALQPAPAPRFSRTPGRIGEVREGTPISAAEALRAWGAKG